MLAKKQEVRNNIQSNLSDSKLSGQPKENRIIQEFELGKLCIKYINVKGPIKNFELFTNSNYIRSNQTSLNVITYYVTRETTPGPLLWANCKQSRILIPLLLPSSSSPWKGWFMDIWAAGDVCTDACVFGWMGVQLVYFTGLMCIWKSEFRDKGMLKGGANSS